VRDVSELDVGEELTTTFAFGSVTSTVTAIHPRETTTQEAP
jgi:hypothetical protein